MRKRFSNGFVVLVMLVLGISGAFASTAWANEIGLKLGYQHSEGIKAGIFYAFDLSDTVAIQPEVYYSQRKYEYGPLYWYGYDMVGETFYDTVRFIEVPVLLKYKMKLRGDFKPVFFGGGYASFRLSRESFMDSPPSYFLGWRRYADVDGGFVVGAGFQYIEAKVGYHFDVRANFGMGWVQQLDPNMLSPFYIPPIENYNRSLSIMVGISF
jgi:hypothetical protein